MDKFVNDGGNDGEIDWVSVSVAAGATALASLLIYKALSPSSSSSSSSSSTSSSSFLPPSSSTSLAPVPSTGEGVDISAAIQTTQFEVKSKSISWSNVTLTQVVPLTEDVSVFVFSLPEGIELTLPVGRHIMVKMDVNGRPTSRPYTPIDDADTPQNQISLLIRRYEYGKMSSKIHLMSVGDSLLLRGPIGRYKYNSSRKALVFIYGGTGVTPIYQVLKYALQDENCESKCFVFAQSRSFSDILLGQEMTTLQSGNLSSFPTLSFYLSRLPPGSPSLQNSPLLSAFSPSSSSPSSSSPPSPPTFSAKGGYITSEDVEKELASHDFKEVISEGEVEFLICGPSGFTKYVKEQLEDFGCPKGTVHVF